MTMPVESLRRRLESARALLKLVLPKGRGSRERLYEALEMLDQLDDEMFDAWVDEVRREVA